MYIVDRRPPKAIIINGTINIRVLSVDKNGIKFGIEAPKEISVHRKEIYEKIKKNGNLKKAEPIIS